MFHLPSRQTLTAALAGGAVAAGISVGPAVAEQTARMARHITGADIRNNSITGRDIRNSSLTGADIRNNTLTGNDIRSRSITGADVALETLGGDNIRPDSIGSTDIINNLDTIDIADNSLRGIDIREGDLGAREIDEASLRGVGSVAGRTPFRVGLNFGETKTVATQGPLSITATCILDEGGGGFDYVRLHAATTEANSLLEASDELGGGAAPTDFLQPDTAASDREFAGYAQTTGDTTPSINNDTSEGYVLDSDGANYLAIEGDTLVLAHNVGGTDCLVAGIAQHFGS